MKKVIFALMLALVSACGPTTTEECEEDCKEDCDEKGENCTENLGCVHDCWSVYDKNY